jgi:hypothetical protein
MPIGRKEIIRFLLRFPLAFSLFFLVFFFVWLTIGSEIILLVLKKALEGRGNLTMAFLLLPFLLGFSCLSTLFPYSAKFKSKEFLKGFLTFILCLFIAFLGFLLVFKISYNLHYN